MSQGRVAPVGANDPPDSAIIYVLKNGSYYPSSEAISSGAAVSNQATIPFEAGKAYKIRIINMGALASPSSLRRPLSPD